MNKVKESKAIKMRQRAEGRQKVHPKVTRTAFHYLLSGSGVLKTLRLCFVLGAAISFIIAPAHESYIAILLLECCIVLSFIIIYVLGLHHLLLCILWPIFDIFNCLLTGTFLIIIGILVLWEEGTDEYIISGAACCFTAAGVCILEVACQGGRLWYNKWKTAVKDNRLAGKDMKKETSDTTGEKAVAEERGAMAMRK
uniref:CKLF-like MARVEL transmembrane domain-containing protein 1 isoform X1 n=1 Tax=Phascolarctos cinereus TaxID=38626 RepID=A0A6P5KKX2_PHACI|nr:CKLF-like MARVEL transmembrane domain-containing protein 1 isoform X1 [Phascolarctos cinereus]